MVTKTAMTGLTATTSLRRSQRAERIDSARAVGNNGLGRTHQDLCVDCPGPLEVPTALSIGLTFTPPLCSIAPYTLAPPAQWSQAPP